MIHTMCVFLGPAPKPCPSCKSVAWRECNICKGFGFIIEGPDSDKTAWDWAGESKGQPIRNFGKGARAK